LNRLDFIYEVLVVWGLWHGCPLDKRYSPTCCHITVRRSRSGTRRSSSTGCSQEQADLRRR